ncbi:MAG: ABC-three component system middle component 6 [Bacteroidales bacterium]
MPSKHINFSQSLLGFGSYLLTKLQTPKSIDELWREYQTDLKNDLYSAPHSFDSLNLTLIFLYGINTIKENNGIISRCN